MKHTSLLTDYFGRLYCPPTSHNHLRLFQSLIPGSEILTAVYESEPSDIENFYFRYQFVVSRSEFIEIAEPSDFRDLSLKTTKFLGIWKEVIYKLNFIYEKERSAFLFEDSLSQDFKQILIECKNRCEILIVDGFNNNKPEETSFLIKRELLSNMLL